MPPLAEFSRLLRPSHMFHMTPALLCAWCTIAAARPIALEAIDTGPAATQRGPQALGDDDPMRVFRASLLREGSTLVEAYARLRHDVSPAGWTLIIEGGPDSPMLAASANPPRHELTVLPCTRLTEMQRILDSAASMGSMNELGGDDVRFKVSGRVFVFRDRNYFLPTHAVVVTSPTTEPADTAPASASQPTTGPDSIAAATRPGTQPAAAAHDDSAEAIVRSLERAAGPLSRSSASATVSAATRPRSGGPRTPEQRDQNGATGRNPAALQENSSIVNRRGKITRDRSGGWLLVFDADASGLSDPPLRLLPCMLLESIEDYARRLGNNSPIIITGQVYLYDGQNYLLPTVYRIPHERSRITP